MGKKTTKRSKIKDRFFSLSFIFMEELYMIIKNVKIVKNNEMVPFAAAWMNLEIIILSEVHLTEKNKYHMILLICST